MAAAVSAVDAEAKSRGALIDAPRFAACMAAFEPFEPMPTIGVAVSGGPDSLALVLLTDSWVRARGGSVRAVTVDHGLRAAGADEANQVGLWLRARGIAHDILRWVPDPKPASNLQARARDARFHLLGDWCREQGILHLLVGHHRDDQAETFLLRLARGSGLYGLSGMAPIEERPNYRLLRPLLDVPPHALRALLAAADQGWVEDPSNRDPAFARVRMRQAAAGLEALGLDRARLADTTRHLGRARAAIDRETDGLMARAVTLHAAGFARFQLKPWSATSREIRLRVLAAVIATISGAPYPPRFERLERLEADLAAGKIGGGRTLSGCRVLAQRGQLLVFREESAVAPPIAPSGSEIHRWDGRFMVAVKGAETLPGGLSIGAIGDDSAALARAIASYSGTHHVPPRARRCLPGLRVGGRLISVPHLGWSDDDAAVSLRVGFRPTRPLTGGVFQSSDIGLVTY